MLSQQPPCRALSPSRMCIDGTEQVRCAQRKLYRHTGKINPGGGTVSSGTKCRVKQMRLACPFSRGPHRGGQTASESQILQFRELNGN